MKLLPRRLIFIGLIVLSFAVIFATGQVQATAPTEKQPPNWDKISSLAAGPAENVSGENPASLPPPAEMNPCLHCHIAGEIYNEWAPISRWFVFGAMGLTFFFGISRNFIVWRTRERWHDRWMFHLGRITALFFVLQASTGIILFIIPETTSEIIGQVMSIIQAIHWGSSIALFIAALGFSLGGALLPEYQRPFWAMIFITSIIGGALAVANLSFNYLYAEWHDPPPPSHLFILHMLLSPIAIASIINIYFMVLRKRGETQ
jgi:hypothetical protein